MCHSAHCTTSWNFTVAFGASGLVKAWKVVESGLSRPWQEFRLLTGLFSSVGIAASSARVVSRVSSIHAIACGFASVTLLVFVTWPVIVTACPGLGVAGVNESMVTSTTGSSAAGLAAAVVAAETVADATIIRLAAVAAESLSRRLNTPSP